MSFKAPMEISNLIISYYHESIAKINISKLLEFFINLCATSFYTSIVDKFIECQFFFTIYRIYNVTFSNSLSYSCLNVVDLIMVFDYLTTNLHISYGCYLSADYKYAL